MPPRGEHSRRGNRRGDSGKYGRLFFRTTAYVLPHPWIHPTFYKKDVLQATMTSQRSPNHYRLSSDEVLSPGDFTKTFVKHGHGSYLPERGDRVEVHLAAISSAGHEFASTRHGGNPLTIVLGAGGTVKVLNIAIQTMRIGERAVFTIPCSSLHEDDTVTPDTAALDETVEYDIELLSTIKDLHRDGGIIMKVIYGGYDSGCTRIPSKLDDVYVKYSARLHDGTVISKSDRIRFTVKDDGHFCPAIAKAVLALREGQKATLIVQPEYAFGEEGRSAIGGKGWVPPNATIEADLELLSFNRVRCIGDDKTIFVKTLTQGHREKESFSDYYGNQPRDGASVQVKVTGRLQDGTVFMKKGYHKKKPFKFRIDEDKVVEGLDEAVKEMEEGEVVLVTVPPQYAFGARGSNQKYAVVPPNATVTFEVELVSIVSEGKDYWSMDSIDAAGRRKAQGDAFFMSGQYRRASKKYKQAVRLIRLPERYDSTDEESEEADEESCSETDYWEGKFKNSEPQAENNAQDEILDDNLNYIATEEVNIAWEDPNRDLPSEGEYERWWERPGQIRVPSVRSVSEGVDTDPNREAKYKKFKAVIVACNLRDAQCQIQLEDYREAAHLCTEVLIIDTKNCEASDIRSQAYSLLSDNRLTEFDIMFTLEDLGLKHASENNLQRRLVLLNKYKRYRWFGSKDLMSGDIDGEEYETEGSGDVDGEEYETEGSGDVDGEEYGTDGSGDIDGEYSEYEAEGSQEE